MLVCVWFLWFFLLSIILFFFRFFWFFDLAVAVAVDFVIAAAIVTVDDTEVLQPNELI